jgi:hypothetical protein
LNCLRFRKTPVISSVPIGFPKMAVISSVPLDSPHTYQPESPNIDIGTIASIISVAFIVSIVSLAYLLFVLVIALCCLFFIAQKKYFSKMQ